MFRYYYHWMPRQVSVNNLVEDVLRKKKDIFFIQIGANDGIRNDPLLSLRNKYSWKGILIEPQKSAFRKLQHNFEGNRNLVLVNAAISNKSGVQQLYRLSFSEEEWATARSSFKRETLKRSIDAGIVDKLAIAHGIEVPSSKESYITSEPVQSLTFDDLVKTYNVDHVDFLLIDTEGFDYEILKLIDLRRYKPLIVFYEYKHLSLEDYRSSVQLMRSCGYKLYRKEDSDILAVHERIR